MQVELQGEVRVIFDAIHGITEGSFAQRTEEAEEAEEGITKLPNFPN